MPSIEQTARRGAVLAAAGLAVSAASSAAAAPRAANRYRQENLVSDVAGNARITDPHLVNPWGLAAGPATPLWVSDNGADAATIYSGIPGTQPQMLPLVVSIPGGAPTGQVYNPTRGFVVRAGGKSGPALFLFSSEAGRITGWSPSVPPSTQARTGARKAGAVYKGLAIASAGRRTLLYATDFRDGTVDVYDSHFAAVRANGAFRDRHLPQGYAPFGIQAIRGKLYVTYAKQKRDRMDDAGGPGRGFVDVYTTRGRLVSRLVSRGRLDSPWGLALAPRDFGAFSGDLLVGNFGDGAIDAYHPRTGAFAGALARRSGAPLRIDGLWGLRFGNGSSAARRALVFSAGPDDEQHGLLGQITAERP